jgi:hypothetical protein
VQPCDSESSRHKGCCQAGTMIERKSRGLGLWWLTGGGLLWSVRVMVSRQRLCGGRDDARWVEDGSQPSDGDHSFSVVV